MSKLILFSLLLSNLLLGNRYYDAALGRFIQIDPKAEKFRTMNPYTGMGNNPLKYIDPDGKEIIVAGTKQQKAQINSFISNLQRSDIGKKLYSILNKSSVKHFVRLKQIKDPMTVAVNKGRAFKNSKGQYKIVGNMTVTNIDPSKLTGLNDNEISAIIGHEFQHASDLQEDTEGYTKEVIRENKKRKKGKVKYQDQTHEARAIKTENKIKNELDKKDNEGKE